MVCGVPAVALAAEAPPKVLGESAAGESRVGVQLSGLVNPEGGLSRYEFEYGTTAGYGSHTLEAQAGSEVGEVVVGPIALGGLRPVILVIRDGCCVVFRACLM